MEQRDLALPTEPVVIQGGLAVDDRGVVRFINDLDLGLYGVRRFYVLENHAVGFVRAWHGHYREAKIICVLAGAAVIGVAPLRTSADFLGGPNRTVEIQRFVLSQERPAAIYVPAGYANGSMALLPGTQVLHFSTLSLAESQQQDDYRWPSDYFTGMTWQPIQR